MTENEEYIFNHFLISIKSGLYSLEDIIADTLETIEDEGWENEISEEWVQENVKREFDKNTLASKSWKQPTDPDLLVKAFDQLNQQKIVALHNAGYTKQDAIYDALDVWKDAEDEGLKPIGYCYYHGQDLDRAIEDDRLFIGFYGATEGNDKEAIIIGRKVVEALKGVGFDVEWNGSTAKRIEIRNFNWQNVFTTEDEVEDKWGYNRVLKIMTEAN